MLFGWFVFVRKNLQKDQKAFDPLGGKGAIFCKKKPPRSKGAIWGSWIMLFFLEDLLISPRQQDTNCYWGAGGDTAEGKDYVGLMPLEDCLQEREKMRGGGWGLNCVLVA